VNDTTDLYPIGVRPGMPAVPNDSFIGAETAAVANTLTRLQFGRKSSLSAYAFWSHLSRLVHGVDNILFSGALSAEGALAKACELGLVGRRGSRLRWPASTSTPCNIR